MSKAEIVKSSEGQAALLGMSTSEIAATCNKLTLVEENCERLSGICATLKGLLLREAKRKLEHGQFLPWLRKNFPKSHKTATAHMRLAAEFAKCEPRFTFDSLNRSLGTTLQVLEQNKLDLKNPIVAEVAEWTQGRSRYQLLLDLGPTPLGGARQRREKNFKDNSDAAIALDLWRPLLASLRIEGLDEKSWVDLPRAELEQLHGLLVDVSKLVGAAIRRDPKI